MDVIELLRRLVEVESVNDPVRGVKPSIECARLIRDVLADKGLDSEIICSNGFYSVFGVIGRGRPVILLLAHYDTVPVVREYWSYEPFKLTVVNGRGYGRGVADDKGNVAAMITALESLGSMVREFTLVYAFTGDEEVGGYYGARVVRDKLVELGMKPDYLINGDGINMDIIVKRRCAFRVELKVKSETGRVRGVRFTKRFTLNTPVVRVYHAAYFTPGVDIHPLIAASHYLRVNRLYACRVEGVFVKSNILPSWVKVEYVREDPSGSIVEVDYGLTELLNILLPLTRCSISVDYQSDYGVTITPNYYTFNGGYHILTLDVRAMTSSIESIRRAIEETIRRVKLHVSVKVTGGVGYLYTRENARIVDCSLRVLESLGLKPRVIEMPGASDSRYFSPQGVECIDIGPIGGNIHGPDEYVELWSLRKLVEFYKRIPLVLAKQYT